MNRKERRKGLKPRPELSFQQLKIFLLWKEAMREQLEQEAKIQGKEAMPPL